jgi:hypothetical protein
MTFSIFGELAPLLHGLSKVNLIWRNKQGLFVAYS